MIIKLYFFVSNLSFINMKKLLVIFIATCINVNRTENFHFIATPENFKFGHKDYIYIFQ